MATGQARVILGFEADTSKARKQIEDLGKSLTEISKIATTQGLTYDKDIKAASDAAIQLKRHLGDALDPKTGKFDVARFSTNLKSAGTNAKQLAQQLAGAGEIGQKAFLNLAQTVAKAEQPVMRINGMLGAFGEQLKQTAKWQLSASAYRAVLGTISSAYNYAKDLNKSLNNIQIVTGQSSAQMADFAKEANAAAKALSTTTTAYSDAALIFYQQGLKGDDVTKRTDTVVKLANVTGESASAISSYMTAIWNNYAKGSDNLEHFGDVITALGAATASSSEEIATGLEKFAAIGDTVGLSYERASAALATVVAETRQTPDVVGTAFKTIFSRIQGLKLGETLEDGVDLNKYSKGLKAVGVEVLNAEGKLRKLDDILPDLGRKWNTLDEAQQTALAQTVAGTRQYAQFIALMKNWDKVEQNTNLAKNSDGTLEAQQEIYAESWEAASKRVKAALQDVYTQLVNDKFFIELTNGVETFVEKIGTIIKSMGGFKGILTTVSVLFMNIFAQKMPEVLKNLQHNFYVLTGQSQKLADNLKADFQKAFYGLSGQGNNAIDSKIAGLEKVFSLNTKLAEKAKFMTSEEQSYYKMQIGMIDEVNQKLTETIELRDKEINKAISTAKVDFSKGNTNVISNTGENQKYIKQIEEKIGLENSKHLMSKLNKEEGNYIDVIIQKYSELKQKYYELDEVQTQLQQNENMFEKSTGNAETLQQEMLKVINTSKELYKGQGQSEAVAGLQALEDKLKEIDITGDKAADELRITWQKAFSTIKGEGNGTAIQPIIDKIKQAEEETKSFGNILQQLNPDGFRKLEAVLDKMAPEIQDAIRQALGLDEAFKNISRSADGIQMKFSQALMKIGSAAMAVTQIINSIKGLNEVLQDDKSSLFDKMLAVLPLVSTLIFGITQMTELMTAVKVIANRVEENGNKTIWGRVFANRAEAESIREVTEAEMEKIAADVADSGKGFASSIKSGIGALTKAMLPLALIAGGVLAIKYVWDKTNEAIDEYNLKQQKAAKESAETATSLTEQYDSIKQSYDNLVSSVDKYSELKNGLGELVAGTDEYEAKLQETNETVLELIETLGLAGDAYHWENGELKIDEQALKKAQEDKNFEVQQAKLSADTAKIEANQKQRENKLADTIRAIDRDSASGAVAGAGTGFLTGIAGGAAIGAGIGMLGGPIASAIGAGIGAIIAVAGGITGFIKGKELEDAKQDDAAIQRTNTEINKLAADYKVNGEEALTEKHIRAIGEFKNADAEFINTIRENVRALVNENELLQQSVKTNILPILETLDSFKNSTEDVKEGISNLTSKELMKQVEEEKKKLEADEDLDYEEEAKKLAGEKGTVTEVKENEEGDGFVIVYYDGDEKHEEAYTEDRIREEMVSDKIYDEENIKKAELQAEKNFQNMVSSGQYGNVLAELIANKQLKNASVKDIEGLYSEKDFNQYSQFLNKDEDARNMLDETYQSIKDLYNSNIKAVDNAMKNFGNKDLSLSNLTAMQSSFKEAFKKMGSEGVKNIEKIYKTIENQSQSNEFTSLINDLDLSNNITTLDEFKASAENAGISLKNLTDQELQNFIDVIQGIGQSIDDIQTSYKSQKDIVKTLKQGDFIDADKYNQLNIVLKQFFEEALDGTYKLVGSAKELNDIADNQARTKFETRRNLLLKDISNKEQEKDDLKENEEKISKLGKAKKFSNPNYDHNYSTWEEYVDWLDNSKYQWMDTNGTHTEKMLNKDNAKYYGINDYDTYMELDKQGKYDYFNKKENQKRVISLAYARSDQAKNYIFSTADSNEQISRAEEVQNWADEEAEKYNYNKGIILTNKDGSVIPSQKQSFLNTKQKEVQDTVTNKIDFLLEYDKENTELINELQDKFKNDNFSDFDYQTLNDLYKAQKDKVKGYDKQIEEYMTEIMQSYMVEAGSYENIEKLEKGFFGEEGYSGVAGKSNLDSDTKGKIMAYNAEIIRRDQNNLHGLDEEKLEKYADYLEDVTEKTAGFNESMDETNAKIYAKQIMRMNRGVETLAKNFYDLSKKDEGWYSVLKKSTKGSQEYADAIIGTKDAVADLLDMETEDIDNKFIEDNLDLIKDAAQGDGKAIDDLKDKLHEEVKINLVNDLKSQILDIEDQLNGLDKFLDRELKAGIELDDTDFIEKLNEIVEKTGMSAEQINKFLKSRNIEAKYVEETDTVQTSMPITETVTEQWTETGSTSTGETDDMGHSKNAETTIIHSKATPKIVGTVKVPQEFAAFGMTTDGTTPKVEKLVRKASGAANNYSTQNSGGPKPSKPSGGNNNKKNAKNQKKEKSPFNEFYHLEKVLDKIEKRLKGLQKSSDVVFGAEKIVNLQAQNKQLEKQEKALIRLGKAQKASAKKDVQKLANLTGRTIKLNKNGEVKDYKKIAAAERAKVEQARKLKNKYKNTGKADKYDEQYERAKQHETDVVNALNDIETKNKNAYDNFDKAEDTRKDRVANNWEMQEIQMNLRLNTYQAKKDLLDFKKEFGTDWDIGFNFGISKKNENDFKENAKFVMDQYNNPNSEYNKEIETRDQYQQLTDIGWDKLSKEKKKELKNAGINSQSDLENKLIEMNTTVADRGTDLANTMKEANENYLSMMDDISESWSKVTEKLDDWVESLDHAQKMTELLYGKNTKTYRDNIKKINESRLKEDKERMKMLQRQKKTYEEELTKYEVGTDKYDKALDSLRQTNKEIAQEEEHYIETLAQTYTDEISEALAEMSENMFGTDFESVQENWEISLRHSEEYYDNLQKISHIEELSSKYDKAANLNHLVKNQEKLNRLKDAEIKRLKQIDNLTQKDIQMAEKKLALAEAEIALEEAKNNKSSMKLSRDASGNWNYQYVANEDKVDEAQNNLNKAATDYRDTGLNNVQNLYEEFLAVNSFYQNKINALDPNDEHYKENLDKYQKELTEELEGITAQFNRMNNETNIATAAMIKTYGDAGAELNNELETIFKEISTTGATTATELLTAFTDNSTGTFSVIKTKAGEWNAQEVSFYDSIVAKVLEKYGTDGTNPTTISGIITSAYGAITKAHKKYVDEIDNSGIKGKWEDISKVISDTESEADVESSIEAIIEAQETLTDENHLGALNKFRSIWDNEGDKEGKGKGIKQVTQEAKDNVVNLNTALGTTSATKAKPEVTITWKDKSYDKLMNFSKKIKNLKDKTITIHTNYTSSGNGNSLGNNNGSVSGDEQKHGVSLNYHYVDAKGKTAILDKTINFKTKAESDQFIKAYKDYLENHEKKATNKFWDAYKDEFKQIGIKKKDLKGIGKQDRLKNLSAFDTGGYTGDWDSSEGRLALLHKKELILNKEDTANMLSMINIVRDLVDQQLPQKLMQNMSQRIQDALIDYSGAISSNNNSSSENIFNISAEFPNASNAAEIQEAILSLPNLASQYLNRRR